MAGHSKWSKIKRKKGANDAKRSKIFGRLIKEITVAVKEGKSGDPDFNPRLRLAVSNAKGANMPRENIDRAIKKAMQTDSGDFHEPTYEGYGPGGVAIFVECTTDNLNRTVANVRAAFNKRGGSLATSGSVDFLFERKGVFVLEAEGRDLEELELALIDGGAEEVEMDEESNEISVTVDFTDFGLMQQKLDELNIEAKSATLERFPLSTSEISMDDAKQTLSLLDILEEDEDVANVFHNIEMTEELEALMEE